MHAPSSSQPHHRVALPSAFVQIVRQNSKLRRAGLVPSMVVAAVDGVGAAKACFVARIVALALVELGRFGSAILATMLHWLRQQSLMRNTENIFFKF